MGAGSDQTDRKVEGYNITVSKQMCDKPIAPELWAFTDVESRWDRLILRSWAVTNGNRQLYQEAAVSSMLPPATLIRKFTGPAIGGLRPAQRFEFELEDPVLGRSLRHGYSIRTLPVVG